jgi:hypothetical protein
LIIVLDYSKLGWVIVSMFNFEALLIRPYNFVIVDDGFTYFEILEGKYEFPLTTCEFFLLNMNPFGIIFVF